MIRRPLSQLETFLAAIGAVGSLLGLGFGLVRFLGVSIELGISLVALIIAFAAGNAAPFVASSLRRLYRARRVFLSYPSEERPFAEQVASALRKVGVKVWVDFEQVRPGTALAPAIKKAIDDADSVVVLLSGRPPSPNLMLELGLAFSKGVRVVPVLLESVELPAEIRGLRYVDLRKDRERRLWQIVEAVAG